MSHVHYKFSSKLSYDTAVFDGPHITLKELKRVIMTRERLRATDCDLQITNAQTKQEYTEDENTIPKGCSVIIRRIPVSGGRSSSNSKIHNNERSDVHHHHHHAYDIIKAMDDPTSSSTLHFFSKMTNLAESDVSEEDKIKVLQNQSAYDPMNYSKKFGAALPVHYTCYRCGNTGHHIRNCPSSAQDKNGEAPLRIKKSSGIPRSFMVEVDDPSIKGAMLTNCGRFAIPAIDAEAYAIGKKEKPPFFPQEQPKPEVEAEPVPDELLCLICHDLLSDAVVIPCCGNSYCDECIRSALLDSEEHVCPTCSQSNVSPDTLIANKFLRQAVNNFKKDRNPAQTSAASQTPNPAPTQSPVLTPPPPSLPPPRLLEPVRLTRSQQDLAAVTLPLPANPPGAASAHNTPSVSPRTEQSVPETPDKEPEAETQHDSADAAAASAAAPAAAAAAVPSVLVSVENPASPPAPPPAPAPSQPIPLVDHTPVAEKRCASVDQLQAHIGPVPRHSSVPSSHWSSSSSSSSSNRPSGGWSAEPQQVPPPSSSCPMFTVATAPPLFPSPLFHAYLSSAQQQQQQQQQQQPRPSYPPGYPAPATPIWTVPGPQGASIPSLCSSNTTPTIPALVPKEWYRHQRKTVERSPPRGSPYRPSSSRSHSKSSKSKSSRSYSHSSSRSRSRSRSRSHGRSRARSPYPRHRDPPPRSQPSHSHGYKRSCSPTPSSSSSPHLSRTSGSKPLPPPPPPDHHKKRHHAHHHHHTKRPSSRSSSSARRGERSEREAGRAYDRNLELDRERYLKWKKEYDEWCEKYYSSYVGHFNQLPPPFLNLPPPPPPPHWEGRGDAPSHRHGGARTRSPSRSSSDSRSPSSHSSSDSRSTSPPPSRRSYDSRSSRSPSASRSTPSEAEARGGDPPAAAVTRAHEQKEVEEEVDVRNAEELGTVKSETEKREEGRGDGRSSSYSADDDGKDRGRSLAKEEVGFEPASGPDKSVDTDGVRSTKEIELEEERGQRRGADSKEASQVDSHPGKEGSELISAKTHKRKEREDPEKKVESPETSDAKKQRTEGKRESRPWPLWEGRVAVKPPKKISININLDLKKKEEEEEERAVEGGVKRSGEEEELNKGEEDDGRKPEEVRDDQREVWVQVAGEEGNEEKARGDEGLDRWRCALKGGEEEEEEEKKTEEEERKDNGGQEVEVSVRSPKREESEGENRFERNLETLENRDKEDQQEKTPVVKTLENLVQQREAETPEQLALVQVPRSKWEKKEYEEEEKNKGEVKGGEPPSSAAPVLRETEGQQSVDSKRDRDRWREEKHRGLAPSSGPDLRHSASYTDRQRGRERGRDGQKESRRSRSKERDRGRERHNLSSSSRHSTSQRGDDHRKSSISSRHDRRRSRSRSRPSRRGGGDRHRTHRDASPDPRDQKHRHSSGNRHRDSEASGRSRTGQEKKMEEEEDGEGEERERRRGLRDGESSSPASQERRRRRRERGEAEREESQEVSKRGREDGTDQGHLAK